MCSRGQKDFINLILWVGVSPNTSPWQHVLGFFASISPSPAFLSFQYCGLAIWPWTTCVSMRTCAGMDGANMKTVVFTGPFWARKLDYHHCCWPQCEWSRPRNKAATVRENVSHWHTTAHTASERWPYRHEAQREHRKAGGRATQKKTTWLTDRQQNVA